MLNILLIEQDERVIELLTKALKDEVNAAVKSLKHVESATKQIADNYSSIDRFDQHAQYHLCFICKNITQNIWNT